MAQSGARQAGGRRGVGGAAEVAVRQRVGCRDAARRVEGQQPAQQVQRVLRRLQQQGPEMSSGLLTLRLLSGDDRSWPLPTDAPYASGRLWQGACRTGMRQERRRPTPLDPVGFKATRMAVGATVSHGHSTAAAPVLAPGDQRWPWHRERVGARGAPHVFEGGGQGARGPRVEGQEVGQVGRARPGGGGGRPQRLEHHAQLLDVRLPGPPRPPQQQLWAQGSSRWHSTLDAEQNGNLGCNVSMARKA